MIFFESTRIWGKKNRSVFQRALKSLGGKEQAHLLFLILLCLFYVMGNSFDFSDSKLQEATVAMKGYDKGLRANLETTHYHSVVVGKERKQLLMAIEQRIVAYLYQIPDYSYMTPLETYLKYRPELLKQFPSCMPLERGNYFLSGRYGVRMHPISHKHKKHFGIDLAAPSGKSVYASAQGTVLDVIHSEKGYGTHIIIRHRFGFETLYGHLGNVLVNKGQAVKQHELIATVGNSGSSTGFHLHYEIMKNDAKIDPKPSLNLKKRIYTDLIDLKPDTNGK